MDVITGTKAEIDEIVALDATEAGLPRRGTPVGPGPHGPISDVPGGPGWSVRRIEPTEDQDGDAALEVDGELEALPAKLIAKGKPADAAKVTTKLSAKKPKKVKTQAFVASFSEAFDGIVR